MKKMNVLLALTDNLRATYKSMLADYSKYFKGSQGDFLGEKRTYTPKEGIVDEPGKRKMVRVVTTVDEKLKWFLQHSERFIDALFAQERTNSQGVAMAELFVDGESWGHFTSLELLRLKSLLENSDLGNLQSMISTIPVRSDSEVWIQTMAEDYLGRKVFETVMIEGTEKTTLKEQFVLKDPNVKDMKDTSNYSPPIGTKNSILELGDYTVQKFSGQWSHRQRAEALSRRQKLIEATIVALKVANECDIQDSELRAKKIFGYIFGKLK